MVGTSVDDSAMGFFGQDTGAHSCGRLVASHTTHISNDRTAAVFSSSSIALRSQQRTMDKYWREQYGAIYALLRARNVRAGK
jgi:hypothetical protein